MLLFHANVPTGRQGCQRSTCPYTHLVIVDIHKHRQIFSHRHNTAILISILTILPKNIPAKSHKTRSSSNHEQDQVFALGFFKPYKTYKARKVVLIFLVCLYGSTYASKKIIFHSFFCKENQVMPHQELSLFLILLQVPLFFYRLHYKHSIPANLSHSDPPFLQN